ncbi:MAG: hypothetical protein SPL30_04310, partial [Succinivibrio sp.]|nr:hypothetical protein [Succinivibrio sp.]
RIRICWGSLSAVCSKPGDYNPKKLKKRQTVLHQRVWRFFYAIQAKVRYVPEDKSLKPAANLPS